jgi:hypothetical protein
MISALHRTDSVKNDPRVIEIVNDEQFQNQPRSSSPITLMTNPKLKKLVEIILKK